jgi:hypothetical protein
MSKRPALLIIAILAVSSLIMADSAFAQSITKPSVPEFTLKYTDHSYDVATTTTSTKNPYNNQTTTITVPGYHVQNMTIDLTIKNQPIPPSIEGNKSYLLFYVRLKGHYGDDWIYPYTAINSYPVQSNSDYTIISFPTSYGTTTHYGENIEYLQAGDQIDFQIKAILAYGYNFSLCASYPVYSYDYVGVAASDWSETQTLTIGESQTPTPSPAATPTPTPPNFGPTSSPSPEPALTQEQLEVIIIVAVAVAGIGAGLGLLIYLTKRK